MRYGPSSCLIDDALNGATGERARVAKKQRLIFAAVSQGRPRGRIWRWRRWVERLRRGRILEAGDAEGSSAQGRLRAQGREWQLCCIWPAEVKMREVTGGLAVSCISTRVLGARLRHGQA
jgi:hypothetical protein